MRIHTPCCDSTSIFVTHNNIYTTYVTLLKKSIHNGKEAIQMGVKKKENPIEDEEAELDPKDVVSLEDYKERTLPFFDRLFSSCDSRTARNCSRKERDENNYTDSSLTYGEILFEPFAEVLLKLKCLYGFRDVGGKFVDIGSGSGKAV